MKKYVSILPASFTAAAIVTIVFTAGEHYAFAAASTARDLLRYIAFVVIASSGRMIRRLVAAVVKASGTTSMLGLQPSMRVFVWIMCATIAVTYTLTPTRAGAVTTEIRVSANTDDAEERDTGTMYLTSSDLELVFDRGDQTVGMRFNGVDIPQAATITKAYVQFKVDEVNSGATFLTIEGEDSRNVFFLQTEHLLQAENHGRRRVVAAVVADRGRSGSGSANTRYCLGHSGDCGSGRMVEPQLAGDHYHRDR